MADSVVLQPFAFNWTLIFSFGKIAKTAAGMLKLSPVPEGAAEKSWPPSALTNHWYSSGESLPFPDATFDKEVRDAATPVVVDFWAEWCGPCRQIGPALEELAAEYAGKVKIVKVNVDENPESPAALGVRGIPALFLFKDGKVVSNKIGAAPKAALKAWIDDSI